MTKLTANRIVLGLHVMFVVASAAALFVATINNSLPHAWQPNVALAAGILAAIAGATTAVTKFLDGSQRIDQQNHELALAQMPATASTGHPVNPETLSLDSGPALPDLGAVAAASVDVPAGYEPVTAGWPDETKPDAEPGAGPDIPLSAPGP